MFPLQIVFMGTAELACASLKKLAEQNEFQIVSTVTQPDKPKGRDLKLQPSFVKKLAQELNLPVLQPAKARDEIFVESLRALAPDLIVVVAYGQILPQSILDLPRLGCWNVHTSLLPKYRGAAPIQWAILNGESETGVTIMQMDAGLDTGDILSQTKTPIATDDNSQTLHDRLAELGATLLVSTIFDWVAGKIVPKKQAATGNSYARKISREDGKIEWSQPALKISQRLKALTPWPGAFTFQTVGGNQRLLKIWEAKVEPVTGMPGTLLSADKTGIVVACGENALRILSLQREGGRRLGAGDFLAGSPLVAGNLLG
ncbi:MAG: methionyl-tRNA formyltransferase [Verrucomicrobiota bacterium]